MLLMIYACCDTDTHSLWSDQNIWNKKTAFKNMTKPTLSGFEPATFSSSGVTFTTTLRGIQWFSLIPGSFVLQIWPESVCAVRCATKVLDGARGQEKQRTNTNRQEQGQTTIIRSALEKVQKCKKNAQTLLLKRSSATLYLRSGAKNNWRKRQKFLAGAFGAGVQTPCGGGGSTKTPQPHPPTLPQPPPPLVGCPQVLKTCPGGEGRYQLNNFALW